MKKLIILLSLLSLNLFASEYLITLSDKHYKNSVNIVEKKVVNKFETNNISHFILVDETTDAINIKAGGTLYPITNGTFEEGYTYCQSPTPKEMGLKKSMN
jgi:hypothetical protein